MDAAVVDGGSVPAEAVWPPYATVPEMIRDRTAAHGRQEFVVGSGQRLTYAGADEQSAALARELLSLGVGKGTRVGLLAPTGPEWVVAWLAINRIGAVLVPLNTFVRESELAWFVRDADVHTLVLQPQFLGHNYVAALERAAGGFSTSTDPLWSVEFPTLRAVVSLDPSCTTPWVHIAGSIDASAVPEGMLEATEATVDPADTAAIMYSSGSTADPKGAIHCQATVVRHPFQVNRNRGLVADDRVFIVMPFFWVGGFHHGLIAAYGAGACLVTDTTFDVTRTVDTIERERVTVVFCWPHQAAAIAADPSFGSRDTSSLRHGSRNMVLPPGEEEDPTHRSNWLGMSETFGAHVIAPMQDLLPPSKFGTYGPSVPGIEHKVVDDETGALCGPGERGVLYVRGYSVMSGRVRALREDVFDRDGWYRTGDVGYFDDQGDFFFQGRADDVIKAGGVNVSPAEIEAVLRTADGVAVAHVLGMPDAAKGDIVVAAVVAADSATLDPDALLAWLRPQLSAYKVPRRIFVVAEDQIPMTATGKVRRGVLRDVLIEQSATADGSA